VEEYGRTGQATDDNITGRMCFARWIIKATDTHSAYVMIIACIGTTVSQSASTLPLYIHSFSCLFTELHMTKGEALFYVY
jgi:hypothetical protein